MMRGCRSRSRASSAPAYPLTPATAIRGDDELSLELANEDFHSILESLRLLAIRADNKNGIVARDGADHLRPVLIIDACGYRLSAASCGDDDEEVCRGSNFQTKAAEHVANTRKVFFLVTVIFWQRVPDRPFRQAHLVDITRECRLGDMEATFRKSASEQILVCDRCFMEEVANRIVSLLFHACPIWHNYTYSCMFMRYQHCHQEVTTSQDMYLFRDV